MRPVRIALSTLLICLAGLAAAQEERREIIVTGEGVVSAQPDMAVISLGVSHEARTAGEAMERTSQAMNEVLTTLADAGIEARDIQTSSVSLSPRWDHSQRDTRPRVVGYVAANGLRVRVRDLDALGGILDNVIGSGANQMNGLSFALGDPRPAQDAARAAAVQDARAKAEVLAEAAGIELGPIRRISEGSFVSPGGGTMMRDMAMEAAVPIASGEVDTRVSVTVIFDILGEG